MIQTGTLHFYAHFRDSLWLDSKNVIRAILGEEPHAARNSDEGLFPVSSTSFKSHPTIQGQASTTRAKPKGLSPKPSGELAIEVNDMKCTLFVRER